MIVLHLSLSENAGVCAEDGPGSELRWEGDAGDSPQGTGTCPGSGVSGQGGHPALNSHPGERARMWFLWQNGRTGGVCAMGVGRGVVGGLWAHLKVSCAVCGCPKEKVTGWPLAHCPQMSWLGNDLAGGIWLTCGLLLCLVCTSYQEQSLGFQNQAPCSGALIQVPGEALRQWKYQSASPTSHPAASSQVSSFLLGAGPQWGGGRGTLGLGCLTQGIKSHPDFRLSSAKGPGWAICKVGDCSEWQTCASDRYKLSWPALIFLIRPIIARERCRQMQ